MKIATLLAAVLFPAVIFLTSECRGEDSAPTLFQISTASTGFLPGMLRRRRVHTWGLPFSFAVTREGFLYILAVFFLSAAAINTGNNLLFILISTLLSTIIISGIVARSSLKMVSLSLQVPENVFAGERVSIKLSMTNTKRIFPSFSLLVEDLGLARSSPSRSSFGKVVFWRRKRDLENGTQVGLLFRQSAYFPILRPGETRSELSVQSFPRRGIYGLNGFWVSTRFPFGLFRRGQRIRARGKVLVYPVVRGIPSFYHLLPFLSGHLQGVRVGPGENLFSIRKYQEGESARIIDWKATSKAGHLMAREFAREEEIKFCLILDTHLSTPPPEKYSEEFEGAVSLAASIASHFIEEGNELELLTPCEHIARGTGTEHLYRILRLLAVVEFEPMPPSGYPDFQKSFSRKNDAQTLKQIFSDKVFKIIITSRPRRSFSSAIWRSSHVVYFDEL